MTDTTMPGAPARILILFMSGILRPAYLDSQHPASSFLSTLDIIAHYRAVYCYIKGIVLYRKQLKFHSGLVIGGQYDAL
jgi:hypothetical protein